MGTEIALEKKVSFAATKGGNNAVFTGKNGSCAILDKFERQENLGKEKEQGYVKNERLEKLKAVFSGYLDDAGFANRLSIEKRYMDALERVKGIKYSPDDVAEFSLCLAQFEKAEYFGEKTGPFLSALINNGDGREFTIYTKELAKPVTCLGAFNTKDIKVKGSVGISCGYGMRGGRWSVLIAQLSGEISPNNHPLLTDAQANLGKLGRIDVWGDAGDGAGINMGGGTLEIRGNVGSWAGKRMYGGRLIVHGNTGTFCGEDMIRGRIDILGDAGIGVGMDMNGGKIRVHGKIASEGARKWPKDLVDDMVNFPPYLLYKLLRFLPFGDRMIFEKNRQLFGWTKIFYNAWQDVKGYFKASDSHE